MDEPMEELDNETVTVYVDPLRKENEFLKAQINALADGQEFLEDCLIEVGQVVYA